MVAFSALHMLKILNSNFEREIQNSCYLCNAFGAHALLAKLTMVTSSEKKAEFCLCTILIFVGPDKHARTNGRFFDRTE